MMQSDHDERHQAFLAEYTRVSDRLKGYVFALVADRDRAEDVLQDLALILWRKFDDFDRQRSFLGWARGVARNKIMQAWDQAKKQDVRLSPEALAGLERGWEQVDEEQSEADRLRALESCLQGVNDSLRQMIRLRYHDNIGVTDIAQRLGKSVAAVAKAMTRVRSQLADCIAHRLREFQQP